MGEVMTPEELAEIVRPRLAGRHPGGATLDVLTSGIRHEQEWWYVPIVPDRELARRYEYYETLADVERELQQQENLTVLFVPTTPDAALTAA